MFTVADIEALTEKQRDVLGMIFLGEDLGHHPRVLKALESKGLIESFTEIDRSDRFPLHVKRWRVPLPANIAYCEWCSTQVDSLPV